MKIKAGILVKFIFRNIPVILIITITFLVSITGLPLKRLKSPYNYKLFTEVVLLEKTSKEEKISLCLINASDPIFIYWVKLVILKMPRYLIVDNVILANDKVSKILDDNFDLSAESNKCDI